MLNILPPKAGIYAKNILKNSQRLHKSVQPFFFLSAIVKGVRM
jgi:hypothetical protein